MDGNIDGARVRMCQKATISPFSASIIRSIDILAAMCLILAFLPIFLVLALLVYATDPGPIIFSHARVGRQGTMFRCLKFRTMVVDAGQRLNDLLASDPVAKAEWMRDHKLRNDPRVTRLGNFLRKTSLDELPQLFNVLWGEMSMVGPRPITQAETSKYGPFIMEYMAVRPGISGLWQISGRNDISYDSRVALDVEFYEKYSVGLYLKIAILTIPAVVFSRGSY